MNLSTPNGTRMTRMRRIRAEGAGFGQDVDCFFLSAKPAQDAGRIVAETVKTRTFLRFIWISLHDGAQVGDGPPVGRQSFFQMAKTFFHLAQMVPGAGNVGVPGVMIRHRSASRLAQRRRLPVMIGRLGKAVHLNQSIADAVQAGSLHVSPFRLGL